MFSELLAQVEGRRGVILYMDAVPVLDAGGLSALEKFIDACGRRGVRLVVADLQFQPLKTIARGQLQPGLVVERDGLEQPLQHWTPSIATCPIGFYTGDAFPRWRGHLFLGSLAKQQLWRFDEVRELRHKTCVTPS